MTTELTQTNDQTNPPQQISADNVLLSLRSVGFDLLCHPDDLKLLLDEYIKTAETSFRLLSYNRDKLIETLIASQIIVSYTLMQTTVGFKEQISKLKRQEWFLVGGWVLFGTAVVAKLVGWL